MVERDVNELRARIRQLEHTVAWLESHLGVKAPPMSSAPGVSARVVALVRAGNKLAAIREHCEETGASLAESKKLIESIE
jgi:ribosomal protein L7/L12